MMVRPGPNYRMTLAELLADVVLSPAYTGLPVAGLSQDSRMVTPGEVFIALDGARTRGCRFIGEASGRGAVAVLVEAACDSDTNAVNVPVIVVPDLRDRLASMASRCYGDPSRALHLTGITGTNGKSSIAHYLVQALSGFGTTPTGCIGTLGHGLAGHLRPDANTTPDIITSTRLLAEFVKAGATDAVMEVSSHALSQGRTDGLLFDTAVFTNLTRDHLDYHQDMADYGRAKQRLFMSEGLRHAVINIADDFGARILKELHPDVMAISYALQACADEPLVRHADINGRLIREEINTLEMMVDTPWGNGSLVAHLSGHYNAANLLACLGVLCLRGMDFRMSLAALERVQAVPGRMEHFTAPGRPRIFVDYAHTPDALEQALQSLRPFCKGDLVCVFGCGGDRDRGKRSLMGAVAGRLADRIMLTSDNPRSESPQAILDDILAGLPAEASVSRVVDRTEAIQQVLDESGPDDVILIAGKGHETWQEIGGNRYPFSDRQLVRNLLGGVQ